MASIDVNWPPARVAWDGYRPHPDLTEFPWEVIFVGRGSGNPVAFNPAHPASSGLQELVMMYAGTLDRSNELEVVAHVWAKRKAAGIEIPAGVPMWPEHPPVAEFIAQMTA